MISMVFHGFERFWDQGAWRPVAACGGLWRRIGSPIRNISGGLEEVADRWEEGIGRTQDIED